MKRVLYLTTSTIDESSARSIQIDNFTRALSSICELSIYSINRSASLSHLLDFLSTFFTKEIDAVIIREVKILPFLVFRGVKIILELHQMPRTIATKILFISRYFARVELVSISEALKVDLADLGFENIHVAHDGIDSQDNRPSDFDGMPSKLNIMHTGSLYKIRTDWLIEAIKSILTSNKNYSITLIGLTDTEIEYLRKLNFRGLYLSPRLKYKDTLLLQSSADVLWYINDPVSSISKYTSPLKLFEYFNTCRPVVCNRYGSVEEIIDSKYPYVYEYESIDSLISAINAIFNEYKNACKLSENYRRKLTEKFSWQNRAALFLDLI